MFAIWDLLDEEEQDFLRGFLPKGWEPSHSIQDIEPLEEIEKLMKQPPTGKQAILSGKG